MFRSGFIGERKNLGRELLCVQTILCIQREEFSQTRLCLRYFIESDVSQRELQLDGNVVDVAGALEAARRLYAASDAESPS